MTPSPSKSDGILINVRGDKTLSHKSSLKLVKSLKKTFNKYADIMGISARKMDPPQKGYGIGIEMHDETSLSYIKEVRDAARKAVGKDVEIIVSTTSKYPPKAKAP